VSSIELEYDFSHIRESKERHDAEAAGKGDKDGAVWAQRFAEYGLLKQIADRVSEGDHDVAVDLVKAFHEQQGSDNFLYDVFHECVGYPSDAYFEGFVEAATNVFDAFEAAEG